MSFLRMLLELATGRRWYSEEDLGDAFFDGVAVGIAFEDGTYGDEDFMGTAWNKARAYLKEDGDCWQDTWRYSGGNTLDLEFSIKQFLTMYFCRFRHWIKEMQ